MSASLDLPDVREKDVWIYALVDASDGFVRYIGKSSDPQGRLSNHRCVGAEDVRAWIERVEGAGGLIITVLLERVPPGEDAAPREAAHIASAKTAGDILNIYTGGGHVRRSWRPHVQRKAFGDTAGNAALRATGLSMAKIGVRLGTSSSVICRWLGGRQKPALRYALAAKREFGIPLNAWDLPPTERA